MNPLNLTDALKLYNVLRPHLPEYNKDDDPLEFISKIMKNIRSSDKHKDYVDAVSLMTGIPVKEILKYEPIEVLETFTNGLITNRITSLSEFAKRIEYNG
jgi:hypothetical protein